MTNGEATAICELVDYLTASTAYPGDTPTGEEARKALEYLADRSYKHLMSGAHAADVRAYWCLPDDANDIPLLFAAGRRAVVRERVYQR